MKEISCNDMKKVTGGAVNWALVSIIGAAVSFLFGIYDGIFNPSKCKA